MNTDVAEVVVFYQQLDNVSQDAFIQALQRMISVCSEERLLGLDRELSRLKEKVDKANSRRERLNDNVHEIGRVRQRLEKHIDGGGSAACTVLAQVLLDASSDIEDEVEDLRPDNDLSKKHKLRVLRDKLISRRRLAERLLQAVS